MTKKALNVNVISQPLEKGWNKNLAELLDKSPNQVTSAILHGLPGEVSDMIRLKFKELYPHCCR